MSELWPPFELFITRKYNIIVVSTPTLEAWNLFKAMQWQDLRAGIDFFL